MSEKLRVATPLDFLPKYLCPHDQSPLRYDLETDGDTHETGAQCDVCGRQWVVTGSSALADADAGTRGLHSFTMREV